MLENFVNSNPHSFKVGEIFIIEGLDVLNSAVIIAVLQYWAENKVGKYILDILFSSNHNIHKSSCDLCFLASDPFIEIFSKKFQLMDLEPKNKGHANFY